MKKQAFIALLLVTVMLLAPVISNRASAAMVKVYAKDQNVALNKTYTASKPYTPSPATSGYHDIDWKELTDGNTYAKDPKSGLLGTLWHSFYDRAGYNDGGFYATVDLGSVMTGLIEFRLEMIARPNSGIDAPSSIAILISDDGKTFTEVGKCVQDEDAAVSYFTCKLSEPVSARYVKASIGKEKSGVFVFCSEFEIYNSKMVEKDEAELSRELEESREEASRIAAEEASIEEATKAKILEEGDLDVEEYPLAFRTGSRFHFDGTFVRGVRQGDTPASICKELVDMAGVQVLDKNGKEITKGNLYTGCRLVQYSGKKIVKDYTILIAGDIDRDGSITMDDYVKTRLSILGETTLDSLEKKAADYDSNDSINLTDYIALRLAVLDKLQFEEIEDSVPEQYDMKVGKSGTKEYKMTCKASDGRDITFTLNEKDWGTWNIGNWKIGGVTISSNSTDFEYVYRAAEKSSDAVVWSGGNHGNESLVELKFYDGVTGNELDLSKTGNYVDVKNLKIVEKTKLNWGDTSKSYCDVIREYTIVGQKISLDVTYDYTRDCYYQLSYTCMFPVPKTLGLYIDFLEDDGTTTTWRTLKKGAADYSGPMYGHLASSECKIYGYQNTDLSFRVQVYTKNDSVENFTNESKLMYWDMNSDSNKIYFTKFDSNAKSCVKAGTHYETSCSWTLDINK